MIIKHEEIILPIYNTYIYNSQIDFQSKQLPSYKKCDSCGATGELHRECEYCGQINK